MNKAVSPLAPKITPQLEPMQGVRISTGRACIKYPNRLDVALVLFDTPATVAGVFTRSRCPSAPVDWCRTALPYGKARALLVNSGNANAFTGKAGQETSAALVGAIKDSLACQEQEIFLASTGVIGEPLDPAPIAGLLPEMSANAQVGYWLDMAQAMMTTDTFPKLARRVWETNGVSYTIQGLAKGAGMIAPDMATTLAFVFTDVAMTPALLQDALGIAVGSTFNAITVDSDTSTSDTILLFATGAGAPIKAADDPLYQSFCEELRALLHDLALQVVCDGEGARHLIEIAVEGAKNDEDAKIVARSIANSPLVKTAIAGEDANWGRVVMAVGKAGVAADRDRLSIWFGPYRLAFQGLRDPAYHEDLVSSYMKQDHIMIRVDMGLGLGRAKMWSCDLTKDYVAINGDYRS
ncbi:bifunctional glutamate N-acetyltransferase/amino-acid acetyltransferase ArgJ [Bartonella sp. DGB2]|uniref:bifunctional glutamate N-acetyltransferase/amino-acid acetyltransferase ArgJ n=1 Tax=Bartonella sp. DGB2 TaxID=3388426 RepID=UPI00398FE4B0